MIERRNFLTGIVQSIAGASALVKLATPEEAQSLTARREVILRHPQSLSPIDLNCVGTEVYVKMNGRFVAVGLITKVSVNCGTHSMRSVDGTAVLIPGLREGVMEFEGVI